MVWRGFCSANIIDDFNRPHRLRFRPPYFLYARVNRCGNAGDVLNVAVRLTKTNVRGLAACIPG